MNFFPRYTQDMNIARVGIIPNALEAVAAVLHGDLAIAFFPVHRKAGLFRIESVAFFPREHDIARTAVEHDAALHRYGYQESRMQDYNGFHFHGTVNITYRADDSGTVLLTPGDITREHFLNGVRDLPEKILDGKIRGFLPPEGYAAVFDGDVAHSRPFKALRTAEGQEVAVSMPFPRTPTRIVEIERLNR